MTFGLPTKSTFLGVSTKTRAQRFDHFLGFVEIIMFLRCLGFFRVNIYCCVNSIVICAYYGAHP